MILLSELTWGEIRQNILKVIEMRKKGVYPLDITSTGGAVGYDFAITYDWLPDKNPNLLSDMSIASKLYYSLFKDGVEEFPPDK